MLNLRLIDFSDDIYSYSAFEMKKNLESADLR